MGIAESNNNCSNCNCCILCSNCHSCSYSYACVGCFKVSHAIYCENLIGIYDPNRFMAYNTPVPKEVFNKLLREFLEKIPV